MAAIRRLIQKGQHLTVETIKDLRALAVAQRKTDQSLKALIDLTITH